MASWASFNQGENMIEFDLTGKAIAEGFYQGTVKLSDQTDFTSYTLYVEVTGSSEIYETVNTRPYFEDFRTEALLLTIGQDEPVVYQLPEPQDEEGDNVEIIVDLNDMFTFGEYDEGSREVTLELIDDSDAAIGLHRAIITLDDGKLQKEYSLYAYVSPEEGEFDDDTYIEDDEGLPDESDKECLETEDEECRPQPNKDKFGPDDHDDEDSKEDFDDDELDEVEDDPRFKDDYDFLDEYETNENEDTIFVEGIEVPADLSIDKLEELR